MLRINEADFPLKDGGLGRIVIFIYAGDGDPEPILKASSSKIASRSVKRWGQEEGQEEEEEGQEEEELPA